MLVHVPSLPQDIALAACLLLVAETVHSKQPPTFYSFQRLAVCQYLQMTVAAMVTSMNPSITARQNSGEDSTQVSCCHLHAQL